MPEPKAVNSMFSRIAKRYDLANRLLSFGADIIWRARLVRAVRRGTPKSILDLATGSGDVSFALARGMDNGIAITGMDFCEPMLEQARLKQAGSADPRLKSIRFLQGDGLALPLPDACFDAVTISFGLRNMADRGKCLREMHRVLKPGGRLHVLEFSQPYPWFRPFYLFYLRHVLPRFAGWITGDRQAYVYLNETIEAFPCRSALEKECLAAGFSSVASKPMSLGIVALHEARQ
jgi:demethylmenaquinone methyltransferase/2-methoxy-6-polyprenyl-1,4-benzoquinol methylase